jgi:F0F1-type ATP synthase assembly protein I
MRRETEENAVSARPVHLAEGENVGLIIAILLLIIVFAVLGFTVVKFLLWIALILAILWVIGFFIRGAEGARWYGR